MQQPWPRSRGTPVLRSWSGLALFVWSGVPKSRSADARLPEDTSTTDAVRNHNHPTWTPRGSRQSRDSDRAPFPDGSAHSSPITQDALLELVFTLMSAASCHGLGCFGTCTAQATARSRYASILPLFATGWYRNCQMRATHQRDRAERIASSSSPTIPADRGRACIKQARTSDRAGLADTPARGWGCVEGRASRGCEVPALRNKQVSSTNYAQRFPTQHPQFSNFHFPIHSRFSIFRLHTL